MGNVIKLKWRYLRGGEDSENQEKRLDDDEPGFDGRSFGERCFIRHWIFGN